MKKRAFFKRTDFIIILILVLFSFGGMLYFFLFSHQSKEHIAIITVDGNEVMRVNLDEERKPYTISLYDSGIPVTFEVNDHRIRFRDVQCPDKICEKTGYIRYDGQTAVCMPNKTILTIHADE